MVLDDVLRQLERDAIRILRQAVMGAENPVMLYSVGKDSGVMVHLARKAFWPAMPPFQLLHVDTGWKFRDMYAFREAFVTQSRMRLLTYQNPRLAADGITPFTHGSKIFTTVAKTEALKQALTHNGFDVVFGGARRDEEASRSKERVYSFRNANHGWDPKGQRPEAWGLFNSFKQPGESFRVFPLSNWTELDVWRYIQHEAIPVVPLYFARPRPIIRRDGFLMMVDDDRCVVHPGEQVETLTVRFRTLGCYPLTGALQSTATTVSDIVAELQASRVSERNARLIDHDGNGSMEQKKVDGYF